jgi:hypothetical protein
LCGAWRLPVWTDLWKLLKRRCRDSIQDIPAVSG